MRNLQIWRLGIEFAKTVYQVSAGWPTDEGYNLTSQVRRAAVSVPANIAEGVGRRTRADTARFSQIALGSLYELDTLLEVASGLGYAVPEDCRDRLGDLVRGTSAFIAYQRRGGAE